MLTAPPRAYHPGHTPAGRDPTPLPAPERVARPPEQVPASTGTWHHLGPHGTWLRDPAHRAPAGTPVVRDWLELDLSSGLYDRTGFVVLDGVRS